MTTTQSTRPETTTLDRDRSDATSTDPTPGEPIRPGDEEPAVDELPLDHVFESLKNSRRRQVIQYLQDNEGRASVSELAEHVAAIENDTTVQALTSQQRKRVYVGLYQCHLPKLDDKEIVDYDDDRGTVELGPAASQLARFLDVAERADEEPERPWHGYYLGVAGVGAVGVAIAALGFDGSVGAVAPAIGVVVALLLAGIAVAHAQSTA